MKLENHSSKMALRQGPVAVFSCVLLLLLAFWVWWPSVTTGMPYIYDEDEGHHFNRVVNMVKTGDYNPHYFLKPSLHFYLRMPAVALGFLYEVQQGRARKLQDVSTTDTYGVAGYRFSASHPGILKFARLVSILCGLGSLFCLYLWSIYLTGGPFVGILAGIGVLTSPLFATYAGQVGVDIVMTSAVMVCVTLALAAVRSEKFYWPAFLGSCVVAGLSVSSKYNAFPVLLVPSLAALWAPRKFLAFIAVPVLSGLAFFAGSPFAPVSLPLFLNHMAYEVWHYGLEGHVGHTQAPGLGHAAVYLYELAQDSIGLYGLAATVAGFGLFFYRDWKKAVLLCAFPLLFLGYMSQQKAHFLRNMVVLVPFLWWGLAYAVAQLKWVGARVALAALLLLFPLVSVFNNRLEALAFKDSRVQLQHWLLAESGSRGAVAVDAGLQPSSELLGIAGIQEVDLRQKSVEELYLHGYELLALRKVAFEKYENAEQLEVLREFEGVAESQRIVKNPAIVIVKLGAERLDAAKLMELAPVLSFGAGGECPFEVSEGDLCWLGSRILKIEMPTAGQGPVRFEAEFLSPWAQQELRALGGRCSLETPAQWVKCVFTSDTYKQDKLLLQIARVSVPAAWHQKSTDKRFLGVAVRNPVFSVSR